MNTKGCEFCKFRYDEEYAPPDEMTDFGIKKSSYCKKYEDDLRRFHFSEAFCIPKRRFIIPAKPHGMMCDFFREKRIKS